MASTNYSTNFDIEPDTVISTLPAQSNISNTTSLTFQRGTLDESIWETIKRDLLNINNRLKQVIYPSCINNRLATTDTAIDNNSDLWAPLLFILIYSSITTKESSFSTLFVITWGLSLLIGLHLKNSCATTSANLTTPNNILNKKSILLNNVSVFGYCLFPIMLSSIFIIYLLPLILKALPSSSIILIHVLDLVVKLISCFIMTYWSYSSLLFCIKNSNASINYEFDFIAKYPVFISYLLLSWFVIANI
ncbi:uncharacterized protein SCODWIG_02417 [Saccharomycodes ludwigii]|uniref:Protein YIP n=1 Tax=Saccharomycodes ludwigii TaxID=36035 RepID=A0A376B7I0_9ASCO|nr:hypothetical protein SCDLUD_001382 [Saccharomycodes ludwigii]KAH3901616.1 hypothetical protein SCDLUD_001382 [Saccharomycodes ludwigii]SSD60656.1 uncharacterized protein SCODWIG_02417 [Saccharomycodes ludwigii]